MFITATNDKASILSGIINCIGVLIVDSKFKAHITRALCKELCIKYGYSEKECRAYIRGYRDCQEFMDKKLSFNETGKELFKIEINKGDE